jgi:hypothetical protein
VGVRPPLPAPTNTMMCKTSGLSNERPFSLLRWNTITYISFIRMSSEAVVRGVRRHRGGKPTRCQGIDGIDTLTVLQLQERQLRSQLDVMTIKNARLSNHIACLHLEQYLSRWQALVQSSTTLKLGSA